MLLTGSRLSGEFECGCFASVSPLRTQTMSQVVPAAFTFRFSFPIQQVPSLPKSGKRLLALSEECRVPWPGESLLGPVAGELDLRAAWNARGLAISLDVRGKSSTSKFKRVDEFNGLQVWIDTRDTHTIHRANRFCHWFHIVPTANGQAAEVRALQIPRAVEDASLDHADQCLVACETRADGYLMEAWLPAAALNGFDAETCPRLGFYALLKDPEFGEVPLTIASEFPFSTDPSLWQTLELKP